MHRFIYLLFFCLFCYSTSLLAEDVYHFSSIKDSERFTALTKEIRCVVCQNQSIAESQAPIATDLKNKVYTLIQNQQTDQQIKAYLVKRYGEFILLNPRVNKSTLFLWGFPFLCLLSAIFYAMIYIYKKHHRRNSRFSDDNEEGSATLSVEKS